MGDTLTCTECGDEIDSVEALDADHDVTEIEVDDDGSFTLFENRDLFLCKGCKNPLGVDR